MFKKILVVVVAMFLFNGLAMADYYWDSHALVGGMSGSDGIPIKVSSDGTVATSGTSTVSGTMTVIQGTGTNLHTVVDSGSVNVGTVTTLPAITGSVTANAGTNLNTSALATETTAAKLPIAQNADLGTNTQVMMGGSVTTNAPTYTTGKIQPISLGTDGTVRTQTDLRPGTSVISGQTNVTTAGTEVPIGSSTAILSVTVKAKVGNTGYIYVGTNPVTSTTGFVLSKGESITYDTDNLTDVYIDCSVNGEGVTYTALVK